MPVKHLHKNLQWESLKIGLWPLELLCLLLQTLVMCSSWGIPLAITIAAVSLNKIGYDASEVSVGWCWVRINVQDRVLWMLLTGKIWEFLAYLTLPFFYILIKRHIHIAVRRTHHQSCVHRALWLFEYVTLCSKICLHIKNHNKLADTQLFFLPCIKIILLNSPRLSTSNPQWICYLHSSVISQNLWPLLEICWWSAALQVSGRFQVDRVNHERVSLFIKKLISHFPSCLLHYD